MRQENGEIRGEKKKKKKRRKEKKEDERRLTMEIFFRFQIIRENILYINCNYSRKFSFFLFFFEETVRKTSLPIANIQEYS